MSKTEILFAGTSRVVHHLFLHAVSNVEFEDQQAVAAVLDGLQQSIEYLRTAVPKGGFDISIS